MDNRDAIDFEHTKVATMFRRLLVPTLFGTLSMTAMTAIDGIFVGHGVGSHGVAAVNIVAPVFMLFSGFGLMVGAGCSVVASIHLSRRKAKVARLNVTQAMVFATVVAAVVCLAAMLMPEASVRLLGCSDTLMPHSRDYLFWVMPGFVAQMWSFIGLFIIRLDGAPRFAMWCNIVSALMNIFLDWLMIFPLGLGIRGAAIATAISETAGGVLALAYLMFFAKTMRLQMPKLSRKSLALSVRNIGYHCRVGSSSMMGEMTLAVLFFTGNIVFMRYLGDDGVAAFGVACYYTPFFFGVGNAVAQSAQPIISYSYGAARWDSVLQARRLLFATSFACGLVVSLLFMFFPHGLVALFFDPDGNAGRIAVEGLPYFALGVTFFILNVAIVGYYQSVERIREATAFALLRGLVLLVPAFFLLPVALGSAGIWLAMPCAEALTLAAIVGWRSVSSRRRA